MTVGHEDITGAIYRHASGTIEARREDRLDAASRDLVDEVVIASREIDVARSIDGYPDRMEATRSDAADRTAACWDYRDFLCVGVGDIDRAGSIDVHSLRMMPGPRQRSLGARWRDLHYTTRIQVGHVEVAGTIDRNTGGVAEA